jgi:cell division septation protein DedD
VDLSSNDVTFPRILSDQDQPTTALAVVRPAGARSPLAPPAAARPPPPTDRLPVVPLPAQSVLEASPIVTRPRDSLTKEASDAAQISTAPTSGETVGPGHDGGYQLQVSSFRTQAEGEAFAEQLRARGHKAYVLEARVAGRGTWYRVRIGPFATQHAATQYRASFESREHVVPFVVPPETTARAH